MSYSSLKGVCCPYVIKPVVSIFVCPLLYPQIYQWKSSWGDSRRSALARFAWIRRSTSFLFPVDTWWFARSVPHRCANVPSAEASWKAPFAPSCRKYASGVFESLFLRHIVWGKKKSYWNGMCIHPAASLHSRRAKKTQSIGLSLVRLSLHLIKYFSCF